MIKKGFSLPELMVSLLVSLFLSGAMLFFAGSASYSFQTQRDTVNDRSVLKHTMAALSEEMIQVGFGAGIDGLIELDDANEVNFVSIEDDEGERILDFWVPTDDMIDVGSGQESFAPTWLNIVYSLDTVDDPVVPNRRVQILQRQTFDIDGTEVTSEPVLLEVADFNVEFGLDDGTFTDVTPEEGERDAFYEQVNALRISITTNTLTQTQGSGESQATENLEQQAVQTFFLRSRNL